MATAVPSYCDDWACPIKWSCARHFCRSKDYWTMAEKPKTFFRGQRTRWGCPDFVQDVPRPWLAGAFECKGSEPPAFPDDYDGLKIIK